MVGIDQYARPNRPRHPRLARPKGVRRHFRPFIEDVDDRLRDLIQESDSGQKYPLYKETFFDTGLLNAIRWTVAGPQRARFPRASVARADLYVGWDAHQPGRKAGISAPHSTRCSRTRCGDGSMS